MLIVVYFQHFLLGSRGDKPQLNIIFMLDIVDSNKTLISGSVATAAAISVDEMSNGILSDYNLENWKIMDCKCISSSIKQLIKLRQAMRVDVVIGPVCSRICDITGLYTATYNIPQVSYDCSISTVLEDSFIYRTLARTLDNILSVVLSVLPKLLTLTNVDNLLALFTTSPAMFDFKNQLEQQLEHNWTSRKHFKTARFPSVRYSSIKDVQGDMKKALHNVMSEAVGLNNGKLSVCFIL